MLSICHHKSLLVLVVDLFFLLTVGTFSLHAEVRQIKGKSALPGEECQTSPREIWTQQEKWVWEQVCRGKIADFNMVEDYGGFLNPKENKEWPENRILSPAFLETILLHEPYRGALTRHGVRIRGAWFKIPLELVNATLSHQLWLEECRFDSQVILFMLQTNNLLSLSGSKFNRRLVLDSLQEEGNLHMDGGAEFADVLLTRAKIGGQFKMSGSKLNGKLEMTFLRVGEALFMDNGAEFADVELIGGKIGIQMSIRGSKFTGKLDMNSLQVGGSLFMKNGSEFADVDLIGANIDGSLDMSGSKFTGKLDMDSLQVGQSLFMKDGAEFADVHMGGAKVRTLITMDRSNFTAGLNMNSLQVERHLFMNNAKFAGPLTLTFAKIGQNLNLSNSTLTYMDLTGTHIGGEFALCSPAAQWLDGATLILRNTDAGILTNLPQAWPDNLELDGFTYDHLTGLTSDGTNDGTTNEISWFKKWLEKQKVYSPQPYQQLAMVLRKAGHNDKATDILYAGRNRELREAKGLVNWLGLSLLKVFIGYGYRIYYTTFWLLGFIACGMLVLRISGQGPFHGMSYGIAYSLDMLLPIVRLREHHYDIDLAGWARYYFYLHKLMGYILASFLIAGLSGLTK